MIILKLSNVSWIFGNGLDLCAGDLSQKSTTVKFRKNTRSSIEFDEGGSGDYTSFPKERVRVPSRMCKSTPAYSMLNLNKSETAGFFPVFIFGDSYIAILFQMFCDTTSSR